jgi:GDP-4-dehydro-6-deoxy-D-mannose reductase
MTATGTLRYRSILVTGARGFVGTHLVAALRHRMPERGRLHLLDRSNDPSCDLLNAAGLRRTVAQAAPDLVLHLAAQSSVGQSAAAAAVTWDTNVTGTMNLAAAVAAETPAAVFAFISSSEVYGATFNDGDVDERSATRPQSVYARTKRAAEDAVGDLLRDCASVLIFRPSNHTGPGQDTRFVIPALADRIARIEAGQLSAPLEVGSLVAERDFLDVRDVIDAYLSVLLLPELPQSDIINVASGGTRSIGSILNHLFALADRPIDYVQNPDLLRPVEVPRASIRADHLRAMTGWAPRHPLEDTLRAILDERRALTRRSVSPD